MVDDGRALARLPSAFGSADIGRHLLDTLRHLPLAERVTSARTRRSRPASSRTTRRARAAPGSYYDLIAGHVHA